VDELSVGVVGSGWVAADRYLPVLGRLEGVRIVGIADRNLERARKLAAEYDTVAHAEATDLHAAGADVLFVCTPPFSHAPVAIAAMKEEINVFVEKPMAMNLGETQEMIDTAEANGVRLGVSHNLIFSRSGSTALRKVRSGELGGVVHVLAVQLSSPRRRLPHWYPDLPGGLFFDEAPHMIYLLDALVGNLRLENAWSKRDADSRTIDRLGATFSGESGVRAELTMLFEAPVSEWFIAVICEKGTAVLDLFRDILFVIPPDGEHKASQILRTSLFGLLGHGLGTINTGARYLAKRQFWGHDVLISDFIQSIREKRPPAITGVDGARVLATMTEMLSSLG
jgi:scyllo-inositol 2-dehydrogenase (NADP+)